MNWYRRFMYGRNGIDQLAIATLVLSLILSVAARFLPDFLEIIFVLADYLLLVLFFYRVLSRNIYKRQAENQRFLAFSGRFTRWFRLRQRMARESSTHKYLKCPKCAQRIRAPRGKGLIRIRCQSCGVLFETKT